MLSVVGGTLGVLFMIPLRRALIVKEHGKLPYPEGMACADVLIAGEKGGDLARMVFAGVGVAMLYKFLYGILGPLARDGDLVPHREGTGRSRTPRSPATSRRSTWASATSSGRASPASSSRAACSRGSR